jgi:hypothetical protein
MLFCASSPMNNFCVLFGSELMLSVCFPQERFVIQVTDLLTCSMMLGITAQVKEAGVAWDKGEKKSKCL